MNLGGLVVGLGNPGPQYAGTRHNLGFMVVEALLEELARQPLARPENMAGAKFSCLLWRCRLPGAPDPWLVAMPQTYMNLSGDAVQPLLAWHKLRPDQLLVTHDELDLEPGRIKLKQDGGVAGHNGLKSIAARLGTQNFHRLRLGVGRPPQGGDSAPWVLGRPSPQDRERIAASIPEAVQAILRFAVEGPERAANSVNRKNKA